MNKLSLLIIVLFLVSNCSTSEKSGLFNKKKIKINEAENAKVILTKQARIEQEFNPTLKIKFPSEKFSKNSNNNQNNIGELSYQGSLKKIGKYNFSKFDDFEYTDIQPAFYNDHVILYDNKGTIILYDQNQKVIWKKNFYTKIEKKLKPRLNLTNQKNLLIVTDNIAKYYAINIETGEIVWSKKNIVPFYSDIKIKDDIFYAVDYKNILRSISIKDGSEIWHLKTEDSLMKSNTKLSVAIMNENIYFNNSIGDITAVNINTGQLVWQLPTQNINISKNAFQLSSSKLVINENSILFSNNKSDFYSIDLTTGLINWKNEINSNLKPIVIGKFIITISNKGYLYIIHKRTGNIIRINDLFNNFEFKKRKKMLMTNFFVAQNKIYAFTNNGKLIIVELNSGNIININKILGNNFLQPHVNNDNLFLIRNGSIIKYN